MPTEAMWRELPERLYKKRLQLGIKRLLDVLASLLGLLLLSPVLLCLALWIRLDSKGPALFRQTRVGREEKPFSIFKFRSMVVEAEQKGPQLTGRADSRVTRAGRVLRKLKLDELPQLWNVLRGDMSLVGPRPEVPRYVEHYTLGQRNVLLIRPGITDLASIAYRNENELLEESLDREATYIEKIMPEKLALNYRYIRDFSVGRDLLLILGTVLAVLGMSPRFLGLEEAPKHV